MAKVGSPDESSGEAQSHCPRCQEMFLDARVLPCLHTVCLSCLQVLEPFSTMERGQKVAAHKSILCPVCDSEVALPPGGVRELLPDMLAQTQVLLERLRSGGHQMPCDLCGDGKGEHRCQDCRVNVCEFCCRAHRRQKRTADHALLPLQDLPPGSSLSPVPYCSLHPLEELCLYCEPCGLPSCRDCALIRHQGHDLRPVTESAGRHRAQLQGALLKFEPQQEDLKTVLQAVHGAGEDLRQSAALLRQEVETFTEGYMSAVQEHRLRLLSDIDEEVRRREQALSLQRARIHQQLSDLRTATTFTRSLLDRGPDLHVVRAKILVLNRLKELNNDCSTMEPTEADRIRFSPQEDAGPCHGYPMYGAVQTLGVDPERCEVKGQGLQSVQQGKLTSFNLICKSKSGDPLEHGGTPPRVIILQAESGRSIQAAIQDNRNGTFLISYTPSEPGRISISLCIKGRHIKGSPFSVTVSETLRQHSGIYHCCTFCSSGGQKDARCACGGTMPGGYQGCGHGHKGHPGHHHWSCCGSTLEISECSGVKDSAPRNLLRTVAL
ncbi:E3 ubiquitin-protein ligase TRIM45 [Pseudophryne corroboree]|uniref:E3 ubiquitin-protein ligase TRIM45 n=1 Tax=Pseudophryne corroboree TaxID=495146 RepID=UPI0030814EB2